MGPSNEWFEFNSAKCIYNFFQWLFQALRCCMLGDPSVLQAAKIQTTLQCMMANLGIIWVPILLWMVLLVVGIIFMHSQWRDPQNCKKNQNLRSCIISFFKSKKWIGFQKKLKKNGRYVGGAFSTANGNVNCSNIAFWDGQNWFPLGSASSNGINGGEAYVCEMKFFLYFFLAFYDFFFILFSKIFFQIRSIVFNGTQL